MNSPTALPPPTALQPSQAFDDPQFAPKVLLMGDSGMGKTHSLRTLIAAGITPHVIATEQNFVQTMRDTLGKSCHYIYINPQPESHDSFSNIEDMLKKINDLSYENLCKVSDPFKRQHNRFIDLATTCNNFKCDCCGTSWGNVMKWNTDRALALDSLSGASDMAFSLVVGNKPVRALPDYGVSQGALRMLLGPLTAQMRCMFILISHLSREKDEVTGGTTITASTIGNKLGPDLPRMFSDVIRARRDLDKYTWDTADSQATVVARHLPTKDKLLPDFKQIIDKWKANGGKIEETI